MNSSQVHFLIWPKITNRKVPLKSFRICKIYSFINQLLVTLNLENLPQNLLMEKKWMKPKMMSKTDRCALGIVWIEMYKYIKYNNDYHLNFRY